MFYLSSIFKQALAVLQNLAYNLLKVSTSLILKDSKRDVKSLNFVCFTLKVLSCVMARES